MIIEKNEAGQRGVVLSFWDAAFLGMVAREGLSDEMWLDNLQSHFLHYFKYTGIFGILVIVCILTILSMKPISIPYCSLRRRSKEKAQPTRM